MKRSRGQSMTEFLIVLPVLLLLILGAIQAFLIYQTKSALNYATFEAARAGSLENASRSAIDNGFSRGFAPLFVRSPKTNNKFEDLTAGLFDAREFVRQEIVDNNVWVGLISPSKAAFDEYYDRAVFSSTGSKEIPNHHLSYEDTGIGTSGVNLQDANILKVRISYCMKLIVPFVDVILSSAAGAVASNTFETECVDSEKKGGHRMPVSAHAVIRMQSPARFCSGCFDNY